jgi:predicted MFS family arabinose efflux permease
MSDFGALETNYKYTPHMILLSFIFFMQYFAKSKEVAANLEPNEKAKADRIFWKYIIVFQLAKAADWCLGPYVFEFFEKVHKMNTETIGKMIAISFMAGLFLGPLLVGYLNDKSDKKFPCILYGVMMIFSNIARQFKHPLYLITSQISYGMATSILYSSFENWLVAEANDKLKNKDVKDALFTSAFEKSMVVDSFTAVSVSFIAGACKRQWGITAPYYFSAGISFITMIIAGIVLTGIPSQKKEGNEIIEEVPEPKQ